MGPVTCFLCVGQDQFVSQEKVSGKVGRIKCFRMLVNSVIVRCKPPIVEWIEETALLEL